MIATEGYAAGAPMVLRGLTAFRTCEVGEEEGLGWLPLACRLAHNVWDFDSWSVLSARLVDLARETGALAVLPSALLLRVSNRALAGELADAATLLAEAQAIGKVTGSRFLARYTALVLEPLRGRRPPRGRRSRRSGGRARCAVRARWRPPPTGRARCSATAWAATRRRTPRPRAVANIRRNWEDRSSGPWPSSSRPPSGAGGRSAPPRPPPGWKS
ncbi:hypothetical protein ACFQQB_54740 [Nonomuraea rubra]|uniref:hypothetical protein n=1 Tax=Nonomuraea rubra TaxID=46180 RepID=UPI00360B1915